MPWSVRVVRLRFLATLLGADVGRAYRVRVDALRGASQESGLVFPVFRRRVHRGTSRVEPSSKNRRFVRAEAGGGMKSSTMSEVLTIPRLLASAS
jgi:hypothetical protein